jgi:hypothetical protein
MRCADWRDDLIELRLADITPRSLHSQPALKRRAQEKAGCSGRDEKLFRAILLDGLLVVKSNVN